MHTSIQSINFDSVYQISRLLAIGLITASAAGCGSDDPPALPPDAGMVDAAPPQADAGPPPGFQFPQKESAADGRARDIFGYAVAGDDDVVVIGAPGFSRFDGESVTGPEIGTAHVYERSSDGWVQTAQLLPSIEQTSSQFGWAVGVSGDIIAVGAWNHDTGSALGLVFVFERDGTTWSETAVLEPQISDRDVRFGFDLAVDGTRIAVGGPILTDIDDRDQVRPVYVFEQISGVWDSGVQILPTDDPRDSWFGYSIDLSGDTLVVGAPADKLKGPASGAAYAFEHDGSAWQQTARFEDPNGAANDYFGRDVAVEDELIAVGVEAGGVPTQLDSGAVFAYTRDSTGWVLEEQLLPTDSDVGQFFGFKLEIENGLLIVGANHDDEMGADAGAAYVFERVGNAWMQASKLVSLEGSAGDHFGAAVAVAGDTVIAGARYDDPYGNESGSTYFFDKQPPQ